MNNNTYNYQLDNSEDTFSRVLYHKETLDLGFTHCLEPFDMKHNKLEKFLSEIESDLGDYQTFDFSTHENEILIKVHNENYRLIIEGNSKDIEISIFSQTEKISQGIWDIYKNNQNGSNGFNIYQHSYYMKKGDVKDNMTTMMDINFSHLSTKYYPYIDVGVMFDNFFTGSESILVVLGDPGYGKSKLASLALKHAYENPNNLPYDKLTNSGCTDQYVNIGYVKSNEVLGSDDWWVQLEGEEMDIIIIDDLDHMLISRSESADTANEALRVEFLRHFLSYTDGVGDNKTKFIITTNQTFENIDAALLRKGRLFDILELRKLTREEALSVWLENDLTTEDFKKTFSTISGDVDIIGADLGSEISKRLNDRISTASLDYLKEPNISKIEMAKKTKRISI